MMISSSDAPEILDDNALNRISGGADAEPQDAFMYFKLGSGTGPAAGSRSRDAYFVKADSETTTQ